MSRVKDVCDRARSLWLRVVRSTHPVDDVEDELYRLIDGKTNVIAGTTATVVQQAARPFLPRWPPTWR